MSSQKRESAPASIEHVHEAQQEAEIPGDLLTHVATASAAQVVIAVVIVLAVCYVAKLVMITMASALLLAFVLEPIVWHLQRWRVPRAAGSFIALTLLLGSVYGVCHFSYNKAITFLDDLPKYSYKLRETVLQFRQRTEQLQKTTETILPESEQEREVVKVRAQSTWTDWLTNSASGLTELLIALSFIPFLVYFMLSWKDRMRVATIRLFSPEHRRTADETLGAIASMVYGFIVGNLLCGLFVSGGCVLAFGLLKIPYFYFLGFISGFVSLIPYLGTFLAMLPPLAAGIGTLSGSRNDRRSRRGVWLRHVCDQRALSKSDRQAPPAESPCGDHSPARLGLALGRHGTDPRYPNYGRDEDHIRSRRFAASIRQVAGRVR